VATAVACRPARVDADELVSTSLVRAYCPDQGPCNLPDGIILQSSDCSWLLQ